MSALPKTGTDAGWRIDFSTIAPAVGVPVPPGTGTSFTSDDYRGSIDAALASGLDPGRYSLVIEDMSESDYADLVKLASDGKKPLIARLWLVWNDVPSLGLDPPTAVIRVTALRRRAGQWRYEVVVEGREWVYDQLLQSIKPEDATGALDAAQLLADRCKLVYEPLRLPTKPPQTPSLDTRKWTQDETALQALDRLSTAMVAEAKDGGKDRGGLGMYVIRSGKLQIGPGRLDSVTTPTKIEASDGLITAERAGMVSELDAKDVDDAEKKQQRRDVFTLTLRGRPDLFPGDVISIKAPEVGASGEDLGFSLGVTSATPAASGFVTCYVQEVVHALARTKGFLTTVRCLSATSATRTSVSKTPLADSLWFASSVADRASEGASAEARLAQRLSKRKAEPRAAEVAQVREARGAKGNEAPQTERLWRGVDGDDAKPYGATRRPFPKQKKDELLAAPYMTPFAWGPFGQILPRYPGMRVFLVHRNSDPEDPVEVGALWDRDKAPESQPGDWWLHLPAKIAQADRASVADDKDPPEPTGKATSDLIDADGTRVITVGKLTVKVGEDTLTDAGKRPAASDPPISIEHTSGASIQIDQDGNITIHAKKELRLKAEENIVMTTPKQVQISVGDKVAITKG